MVGNSIKNRQLRRLSTGEALLLTLNKIEITEWICLLVQNKTPRFFWVSQRSNRTCRVRNFSQITPLQNHACIELENRYCGSDRRFYAR